MRRFPIRHKLTLGILVPLLAAIFVCWLAGISVINAQITVQARAKARADLNSAREVYNNELERIRDVVKFTGRTPAAVRAVEEIDRTALATLLSPLLVNEQLDFLNVADRYGRVIFRAGNPSLSGVAGESPTLVRQALAGTVAGGTMVIPYADLVMENPALARHAVVRVSSTPRAKPYSKREERAGMFLVAAAPVRDGSGAVVGVLYGGVLLNNNTALVDRIKRIVFEGAQFEGKNVGTATIFLGGVRIATNVPDVGGRRALGTLMSDEVYQEVLVRKGRWTGRAFVVNDWYFAAYEPLLDIAGTPVGALYVGMPDKPYERIGGRLNVIYAAVLFCGALIGIALSWYMGSRLARPIRALEGMARRVAAGEREISVQIATRDEIGDLANEFNDMTRALAQREEEIGSLNRTLEQKVRERTAELEAKNLLLVKTQADLVRAEKLADLGILAAGVAHEINNPMAIIRGNAELLQMALPPEHPSREEVETIAEQVGRVERIVAGLLTFARQERMQPGRVEVGRMLDGIIRQVGHQVPLTGIEVRTGYAAGLPPVSGDEYQLRQVFTNLVLNAIQAMPAGGVLSLTVAAAERPGLCAVVVTDTGRGMPPETSARVFHPFFTTKAEGTGLGLAVSYGIVKDHGGEIEVTSAPEAGTTFRVLLPFVADHPAGQP